jgi:hypothetical protein
MNFRLLYTYYMPASPTQNKPRPAPNPFEREKSENHLVAVGQQIADVPREIGQGVLDSFVGMLYGMSASEVAAKRERAKQKNFSPLDFSKLEAAQKRNDLDEVARLNQKLQEEAQQRQEHMAQHRAMKAEEERVYLQKKREEEERKRQEEQEEQERKRREQEEAATQAQMDPNAGAGKAKGQLGVARKKASTDNTSFEASKGRVGK